MTGQDTIYALSSGSPPAAIAIIRISGAQAGTALQSLAGRVPEPRRASLASLRDPGSGALLDRALLLWFPGAQTATGEDLAELHLHGGRAVVRAVEEALGQLEGLRRAEPGEFTRRAFANGRIDLAEAEGLADLLEAETEWQRAAALESADGRLSSAVKDWREAILGVSAQVEAELDFADEDDVKPSLMGQVKADLLRLTDDIATVLARPSAERLKQGIRVVLAGPPNAGKSTLLNALADREAAIVSEIAGTTRDLIEVPVAFDGVPFLLTDTAGLRSDTAEVIEAIGVERAHKAMHQADIVLWLGPAGEGPQVRTCWEIDAKTDAPGHVPKSVADFRLSARTGAGLDALITALVKAATDLLPPQGSYAINARQRALLATCRDRLVEAQHESDLLVIAECLRGARAALDALLGNTHVEDMLDALFGRFCIGK